MSSRIIFDQRYGNNHRRGIFHPFGFLDLSGSHQEEKVRVEDGIKPDV
jgi:hypothetical protein